MAKSIIFIFLFLFALSVNSQVYETAIIINQAAKVGAFDTAGAVVKSTMTGEFDVKNKYEDILRFKFDEGGLRSYHCGIVYILYDFEQGWINSISTYGADGKVKGDDEFDDIAQLGFEIKDMALLNAKFESLDQADGNLKMNDADMKIVYQKTYNSAGKLIKENYINTPDYWKIHHLLYRP